MTHDVARATATWNGREKHALIGLLAERAGFVPAALLAEARLRAAEAFEAEIEKELETVLDDYVRMSSLERAATAMGAPNAARLRDQMAKAASRHRRVQERLDTAREATARRRAEWMEKAR